MLIKFLKTVLENNSLIFLIKKIEVEKVYAFTLKVDFVIREQGYVKKKSKLM